MNRLQQTMNYQQDKTRWRKTASTVFLSVCVALGCLSAPRALAKTMQPAFAKLDTNQSGKVSRSELWRAMGALFSAWKPGASFYDPKKRFGIVRAWDRDRDGTVDLVEFVNKRRVSVKPTRSIHLKDMDGDGDRELLYHVHPRNRRRAVRKELPGDPKQVVGYRVAEGLFEVLDQDHNGVLSTDEWPGSRIPR